MDTIAGRAGVGKATIYRRWPSKALLALDAVCERWGTAGSSGPDTGSLRDDLHALTGSWVRLASAPGAPRLVAALLAEAQQDPSFATAYRARFVEPHRQQARTVIARAIGRGEITTHTDVEVAVDLVYGPLYHRLLHGHVPLTERFAREVADAALAGLSLDPPICAGAAPA